MASCAARLIFVSSMSCRIAATVILAACSEPFRAMFSSCMREAAEREVRLHGISRAAFAAVLRHVYTGELELDEGNVAEVLHFSALYDFKTVLL
jgi:membrane-bound lytic murein transglycosylase B